MTFKLRGKFLKEEEKKKRDFIWETEFRFIKLRSQENIIFEFYSKLSFENFGTSMLTKKYFFLYYYFFSLFATKT